MRVPRVSIPTLNRPPRVLVEAPRVRAVGRWRVADCPACDHHVATLDPAERFGAAGHHCYRDDRLVYVVWRPW